MEKSHGWRPLQRGVRRRATTAQTQDAAEGLRATVVTGLLWWAVNVAIGAEDAAIAGLRTEHSGAVRAFVKELAGVGWHDDRRTPSAIWAGDS